MKYKLEEAAQAAIMSNEPLIIVEGEDDIKVYEAIAQAANKSLNIQPVQYFEEANAGGCDNVEKCLRLLQPKFSERPDYNKFVLGIIDADVKPFCENISALQGLFMLAYYSIESYFISDFHLKKLIDYTTNVSEKDITPQTIDWIKAPLIDIEKNLYLVSLECLKAKISTDNYTSTIDYSREAIKNPQTLETEANKLQSKKTDLESFAAKQNISQSDLKRIAKGKIHLHLYTETIANKIRDLCQECKTSSNNITQCTACTINPNNPNSCRYKTKATYNSKLLTNEIKRHICPNIFADIISAFKSLT